MYKIFKSFYNNFCIEHKTSLIFCVIFAFISGFLEILGITSVIPFLQQILDVSNSQSSIFHLSFLSHYTWKQQIGILSIFVTALFIIKNVFMIFYHWFSFKILTNLRDHICLKLLNLIQNTKYIYLLKKNSDAIVNTLDNTVRYVVTVYLFFAIQWLINCVTLLLIVILLMFLFPILTITTTLYSFICFLLLKKVTNKQVDSINKELNSANTSNIGVLQTIIFSIKELKTLKTVDYFLNIAKEKGHKVNSLEHLGYFFQNAPSNVIEILIMFLFLLVIALLLFIKNSYQEIIISLGLLAIVIFRLAPIANRLLTAYTVIKSYSGSVVDLNTIYEELLNNQESNATTDETTSFSEKIHLNEVSFNYNSSSNSKTAIQNIDITINKNDFIGIVGLSGAGKTTLVDIILGLLSPTKGSYHIDDHEITKPNQIVSLFGYVSQNPCIITGTIAENIALGREINHERIQEVMSLCQLDEFMPESEIVEFGKNISGGQKQRIAIARALYGQPQILVLDEVTASLDIVTEKKISDVIDSLKGKCTIIAIAHRLGTLKKCNKIFYMQNGQIIANDSFENLYKASKDFKTMVDLANLSQKS